VKTVKGFFDWLFSQERREGKRRASLPLVAYYWDGAEPVPHAVLNASATGMYLLTQQRWYPGTVVTMTLQRAKAAPTDPERSIAVNAKVVRAGKDGVGLSYVLAPGREVRRADESMATVADLKSLNRFFERVRADTGQALIEFALILPLIFLLIVNAVNFGGLFFAWIGVADATRTATNYAILGPSSAGGLTTPSSTAITSLVKTYSPLPTSGMVINICQNNNGTLVTAASTNPVTGTCSTSTTPADPEGVYTLTSVDVTYTYKPFFKLFSVGEVHLTVSNTTIHQFALMRSIQ
jgi:Flp pilus assembly protein TadG